MNPTDGHLVGFAFVIVVPLLITAALHPADPTTAHTAVTATVRPAALNTPLDTPAPATAPPHAVSVGQLTVTSGRSPFLAPVQTTTSQRVLHRVWHRLDTDHRLRLIELSTPTHSTADPTPHRHRP